MLKKFRVKKTEKNVLKNTEKIVLKNFVLKNFRVKK